MEIRIAKIDGKEISLKPKRWVITTALIAMLTGAILVLKKEEKCECIDDREKEKE